jgi:hypothetical protein
MKTSLGVVSAPVTLTKLDLWMDSNKKKGKLNKILKVDKKSSLVKMRSSRDMMQAN